ncbi:MAG: hypothetical protein CR997_07900 [Acidobacteria bacterium]|nr:MAG: hypothetical protein CR997_07900 [Acidobacteriota bacterium]
MKQTDDIKTVKQEGAAKTEDLAPEEIFSNIITRLDKGSKIAIIMQDNPDPDALGSACGISYLIKKISSGHSVQIIHGGDVSHPQNRTMVNLLNIDLKRVNGSYNFSEFNLIIFVDVASSGQKNLQTIEVKPNIIIDHHEDNPNGDFLLKDIRAVGATATIVADYIFKLGYEFSEESEDDVLAASALFYGIENDTGNLVSENTKQIDIDYFLRLLKYMDMNIITNVRDYPIPRYFFELEEVANKNRQIEGSVLVTGLEFLKPERRDGIPYIADKFLRMEGIETVIAFAIIGEDLIASLRTTNKAINLNAVCHGIFGETYSGAKQGAGGAKVPLGLMAPQNNDKEVQTLVWEAVSHKLKADILNKIAGK